MPAVAVAVASAAASSAVGSSLSIFAWGSFTLGSGALASGIASAIAGFGVSTLGGALIGQGGKKKAAPNIGSELQQGIKQIVRLSDEPYKLIYGKARVGGALAYAESSNNGTDSEGSAQSGDNLFLHMIIVHAGHECNSFEEIYLDDDLVTLDADGFVEQDKYIRDGRSYVRIKQHLGSSSQAADSFLIAEAPNWTAAHRLQGLCYTYLRLQWNGEIFQSGIPTLNCVIKGKKVKLDPEADPLDIGWTDNAALIIRDFLTSRDESNIPYGFGATDDEMDDSFSTAAANICDEDITLLDSSTIKRYTINGVVDTSAAPLDTLESMITSMAGAVTYPKGQFRIHAGAYETPETDVVDESWLAGDIEATFRTPRQDLFNAVRGTFINPAKDWQKDDFNAITSSVYEAQDNNERIFTEIELPYTINNEHGQRIGQIALRKGREQTKATIPCNYKALKFTVWDNIKVSNDILGWDEKIFKIVNLTFDIRGGVKLEVREENSTSYDWSTDDASSLAAAPDTSLPNPFLVVVPTGVQFNSRAIGTSGGDTLYNLSLAWDEHSDAFVRQGGQFEVQFKESADTTYRPSFFVDGSVLTTDIVLGASVNTSYDLRIRAVNTLGSRSAWVVIAGAVAGSSGGVGVTDDWGLYTSGVTTSKDWGDWTSTPTTFEDWGYYT
jgi:hypothetical protein